MKIGCCIILTFKILCGYTQGLINATSVYIPEDISVYVDGVVINTGFIQNKGTVSLSGDWQNKNIYQGRGKIILKGADQQVFFNNKQAVHHLVMNSSSPKYIRDRVTIDYQLDLLKGLIYVGDNDTLQLSEKAIITVGSLSSYIDGALTTAGVGYKFFPIGKNGKYRPIELIDVRGIDPIVEMEVFEDAPSIDVKNAVANRDFYWQRRNIKGFYENSPVSIGVGDLTSQDLNQIVLIEGTEWNSTFNTIQDVDVEIGDQVIISTKEKSSGALLMFGETTIAPPNPSLTTAYYFSTSLSPNAANADNRTIKLFGNTLRSENFSLNVFNRWGLLVYESTSLEQMVSNGWDGRQKSNGNFLPSGVYPYILKAIKNNGEVLNQKGVITIIH